MHKKFVLIDRSDAWMKYPHYEVYHSFAPVNPNNNDNGIPLEYLDFYDANQACDRLNRMYQQRYMCDLDRMWNS